MGVQENLEAALQKRIGSVMDEARGLVEMLAEDNGLGPVDDLGDGDSVLLVATANIILIAKRDMRIDSIEERIAALEQRLDNIEHDSEVKP